MNRKGKGAQKIMERLRPWMHALGFFYSKWNITDKFSFAKRLQQNAYLKLATSDNFHLQ